MGNCCAEAVTRNCYAEAWRRNCCAEAWSWPRPMLSPSLCCGWPIIYLSFSLYYYRQGFLICFCTNISKFSIFVQTLPSGVLHFPFGKCNCNAKTTCLKPALQFYFRRCWHKRVFIHLTFKLHDCVNFWSTDCWVVALGMPHKKALASRVSLA